MAKKPKSDNGTDEIKNLFPETGMTDFEAKIAKDAGLSHESIKSAMDEPSTTEEAYAKIMGNLVLSAGDRRKLMAELSPKNVMLFAVSYERAELFHNDILRNFLDQALMLSVSKQRKGRLEIIKLSGAIREQEMKRGLLARIASMGNRQGQGMV